MAIPSWLHLSKTSGGTKAPTQTTVTAQVDANTGSARSYKLTVKTSDNVTKYITVNQEAMPIVIPDASEAVLFYENGGYRLYIETQQTYNVDYAISLISFTNEDGYTYRNEDPLHGMDVGKTAVGSYSNILNEGEDTLEFNFNNNTLFWTSYKDSDGNGASPMDDVFGYLVSADFVFYDFGAEEARGEFTAEVE